MPCEKYKSLKQRNLCFATDGWKDWSNIKPTKSNKKQNEKRK